MTTCEKNIIKSKEAYQDVASEFICFKNSNDIKTAYDTSVSEFTDSILENFAKVIDNLIEADMPECNILVLYHSDLDGNASAYATNNIVNILVCDYLRGSKHDDKYNNININVTYDRINYNYDLEKCGIKYDLEICDIVFIVDYSLRPDNPHMKMIYDIMTTTKESAKDNTKNIVWIDHHDSSTKEPELKSLKEIRDNFLSASVSFVKANIKGLSAAMLCWILSDFIKGACTTQNISIDDTIDNIPDIIGFVSLYDTFHSDANPDFYYAIGLLEYEVQNRSEGSWWNINDYSRSLHIFDPFIQYGCIIFDEDDLLYKLLEKGALIRTYVENSHKIYRTNTLMQTTLLFEGKQYSVPVINAKGNSFIFGDSYYENDGVIMYYFNNNGTYTYSFFANENNDNTNRLPCNSIAEKLGGGGHKGAAGCTIPINIFEHYIIRSGDSMVIDMDRVINEVMQLK